MWRLHRKPPAEPADVVVVAEQTAREVARALQNLEETYQKIREPIMTLDQRFPLLRQERP